LQINVFNIYAANVALLSDEYYSVMNVGASM